MDYLPERGYSWVFSRWFDKHQNSGAQSATPQLTGPRVPRHSGGWTTLRKRLGAEQGLRVLDVGVTSPTNINFLTNMGQSVYMADLVHDAWTGEWQGKPDEDGNPTWDIAGFQQKTLEFSGRSFDIVLLWTVLDYLPEALVAPVVERLYEAMNPGGQVLSFFHTRMHGEETAHCRFHLTESDNVEWQLSEPATLQRVFTNRSIEKVFSRWSGHKQFLAKDSISEVLMTR